MPATIKLGSSGPGVTEWQGLLVGAGFPVPVTGSFDQATHDQTKAWQSAKGLTVDGIVGPASWSKMTGVAAPAPSVAPDKNAAFGRAALLEAWPSITGEQPILAELQIAGAQAHLESNYGKASYKLLDHSNGATLATSGPINNWGAVQTSEGPPGGFLATDTGPKHITPFNPKGYYDHHYKVYPTPAAGAAHMVEHMTKKRPTSWALMKTGDIDAWAEQMHAGFDANGKLKVDPVTKMPGYFEQSPSQRAKGIEQRIAAIAASLGEPIAAKRGGPMPAAIAELPSGTDVSAVPDAAGTFLPTLPVGSSTLAKRGLLAALFGGGLYLAYRAWRGR